MESTPPPPPPGTRDLLPPEADERAFLLRRMSQVAYLQGYHRVVGPPFERASLFFPDENDVSQSDLVQLVEPESGEIACLRPDMTPQVARMVATELQGRPSPYRLYYDGVVVRRARGRARRHQQMTQLGVELVQAAYSRSQLPEVVELLGDMLHAAGLSGFTLELNHAGVAKELLSALPHAHRIRAAQALRRKNPNEVRRTCDDAGVPSEALTSLLNLYGGLDVIEDARKALGADPTIKGHLEELSECAKAIQGTLKGGEVTVDLGEPERMTYYRGVSFALYGPGPGTPIGAGGVYETPSGTKTLSGAGFALTLESLEWALSASRTPRTRLQESLGVALVASAQGERWQRDLVSRGVRVSRAGQTLEEARAYAASWGLAYAAEVDAQGHLLLTSAGGSTHETPKPFRTCDEVVARLEEN